MLAKELIALGVNLSLNPRNAELMVQDDGLKHLMGRLFRTYDALLMKVRRDAWHATVMMAVWQCRGSRR
mgnify:CR=1 FL=1